MPESITTVSLGAASWTLAKAKLDLKATASASLNSHHLAFENVDDLRAKDVWIHPRHNFHLSFLICFDSSSPAFGTFPETRHTDFIASALTQAPCWSQLRLVPSVSGPNSAIDSRRVGSASFDLKLQQDSASEFDLSNVPPPNGIFPVCFVSVQISLIFSQRPTFLTKSHNLSEEVSFRFEDLLGSRQDSQTPHVDLKILDWQNVEDEILDDHEAILHHRPYNAGEMLCDLEDPARSARSLTCAASGSLCRVESNFDSLESCTSAFSSQRSKVQSRVEEDMTLSGGQSSFQTSRTAQNLTPSSTSIFESLEPEPADFCHSAEKGTTSPSSCPTLHTQLPPQLGLAFYQSILSLTDAAVRTLIHPQPTRLSAGIKLSGTDAGRHFEFNQDTPRLTTLSDLAPSIFTPGYAQAVVERAPFVPSIAKSLATFLRYAYDSGSDDACDTEAQGRSAAEEGKQQEDVKEILRGHVWMTMANALRRSHSEKARRLRPLEMPRPWRVKEREERVAIDVEDEMELLDGVISLRPLSPRHCTERADEEILEGLASTMVCEMDDEFEEDLLLDDMERELSFLGEELEELYLSGRADCLDDMRADENMVGVAVSGDSNLAAEIEEMLF